MALILLCLTKCVVLVVKIVRESAIIPARNTLRSADYDLVSQSDRLWYTLLIPIGIVLDIPMNHL